MPLAPTADTGADPAAAAAAQGVTATGSPQSAAVGADPAAAATTASSASESTATPSSSVRALAAAILTLNNPSTAATSASTKADDDVAMEPAKTDSIVSGPNVVTPNSASATEVAAAVAAKPSGSSSASLDPARAAELLRYYRELSDHVVREGTAGWDHAGFGGVLMTEWQPESLRFVRPFSLVWLHDDRACAARNDDQELPSHLKTLPLLPHWTFGLEGDGDCMMRALVLGDVAGVTQQAPQYKPIWDAMLALPRDPLWGKVQPQGKAEEDTALASYRQAYVTLHIAANRSRVEIASAHARNVLTNASVRFCSVWQILPRLP